MKPQTPLTEEKVLERVQEMYGADPLPDNAEKLVSQATGDYNENYFEADKALNLNLSNARMLARTGAPGGERIHTLLYRIQAACVGLFIEKEEESCD